MNKAIADWVSYSGVSHHPFLNMNTNLFQVDKIVVAQEGLERLINDLCPKACLTLTRVDFKALDSLSIRPIGVYGDRCEIARFLTSLEVINNDQ